MCAFHTHDSCTTVEHDGKDTLEVHDLPLSVIIGVVGLCKEERERERKEEGGGGW